MKLAIVTAAALSSTTLAARIRGQIRHSVEYACNPNPHDGLVCTDGRIGASGDWGACGHKDPHTQQWDNREYCPQGYFQCTNGYCGKQASECHLHSVKYGLEYCAVTFNCPANSHPSKACRGIAQSLEDCECDAGFYKGGSEALSGEICTNYSLEIEQLRAHYSSQIELLRLQHDEQLEEQRVQIEDLKLELHEQERASVPKEIFSTVTKALQECNAKRCFGGLKPVLPPQTIGDVGDHIDAIGDHIDGVIGDIGDGFEDTIGDIGDAIDSIVHSVTGRK